MLDTQLDSYVLAKLISFIKYTSRDPESTELAASPLVGEIFKKVLIKSQPKLGFNLDITSSFGRKVIEAVKFHVSETENWEDLDAETKREHIFNMVYPFLLDDSIEEIAALWKI